MMTKSRQVQLTTLGLGALLMLGLAVANDGSTDAKAATRAQKAPITATAATTGQKFPATFEEALHYRAGEGSEQDRLAKLRFQEEEEVYVGAKIKRRRLSPKDDLTVAGITANSSKLADVVKVFGPNTVVFTGDAASSEISLCYVGSDGTAIAFASGEMHSGDLTVGDIEVGLSEKVLLRAKCKTSDAVSGRLATPRGIRLGLSREKVRRLYGKPSKTTQDFDLYLWEWPLPRSCTRSSTFKFWFKEEKIIRFSFSQLESC